MGMGTEVIDAAADGKPFSADQSLRQFVPGGFINSLHGSAGNLHLLGTLLLRKAQVVNEADGLVFIDRHVNLTGTGLERHKLHYFGQLTDPPAFDWACHETDLLCVWGNRFYGHYREEHSEKSMGGHAHKILDDISKKALTKREKNSTI